MLQGLRHWPWLLPLAWRIEACVYRGRGVGRGGHNNVSRGRARVVGEAGCLKAPGSERQALADLRCSRKEVWLSGGV